MSFKEKRERIDCAVIIPVFRGLDGELKIVFVERADWGIHGGQIAFPGGKRDVNDSSLLKTALRETEEEIGLDSSQILILKKVSPVDTLTTGFRIYPFLAKVNPPAEWKFNSKEVKNIIIVEVKKFLNSDCEGKEMKLVAENEKPIEINYYKLADNKIWGATYRILKPLIPQLLSGKWQF